MDYDTLITLVEALSEALEKFSSAKNRQVGYDPCGDAEKQKRNDMIAAAHSIKRSIENIYDMEG